MKGGLVHGSHSRTTFCAIPEERFSWGVQGSRCEGGFEDPHPQFQEKIILKQRKIRSDS
jgi:hypothetical protein